MDETVTKQDNSHGEAVDWTSTPINDCRGYFSQNSMTIEGDTDDQSCISKTSIQASPKGKPLRRSQRLRIFPGYLDYETTS